MLRNILVLLFIFIITSGACSQSFTSDKILDTTALNLRSQTGGDIAVGPDGVLGVTWVDLVNPWPNVQINILNFAKSTDHGETFVKIVLDSVPDLAGYSAGIGSPKLHFDKTGNIWIAENISVENSNSLCIYKSTDGGETFIWHYPYPSYFLTCHSLTSDSIGNVFILAPHKIWGYIVKLMIIKFIEGNLNDTVTTFIDVTDPSSIYFPSIAADKAGKNMFLVFQKNITNSKLFFSRSEDGGLTFSSPRQLDTTLLNEVNQRSPAVVIWNNKVVVTWSDNRSGEYHLYYAESADSGNTFTPPIKLSNESAGISKTLDNNGMLNILWASYNYAEDIYYTNRIIGSDTFSVPVKPGNPAYYNSNQIPLGIAADHEGFTYILFQDDRPNTLPYPQFFDSLKIFLTTELFTLSRTDDEIINPADYHLLQNYPNPFNPTTTIRYSIPAQTKVVIKVYDMLGNEMALLMEEEKPAGTYELNWNAANLPSGVYFYRIHAGEFISSKKMILIK